MAATTRKTNPRSILTEPFILFESLSRLPVQTILESRPVCKSWLSLTSNPAFIKSQLCVSTDTNIFSWLPKHVVYNIFSRLTVKDLLRMKSVCKPWLSLVSSRGFIKTHLINSTNDLKFTNHQLFFCNAPFITHEYRPYVDYNVRGENLVLRSCSVYSLINGKVTKSSVLENPGNDMDGWTYVVGCCNGLVCLACFDGSVFLWNPSTRKSSRLPEYERPHTVFGFGYDESKDEFKVFSIVGDEKSECKVSVYSSNSHSWRMIGAFPFGELGLKTSRGQFAHGALHWLVSQKDVQKDVIVALDVNTETHRELVQPDFGQSVYDLALGTIRTSLSVLCQHKSGADLWVLKEYGVEELWTKVFTFPIPCDLPYKPRLRAICMFENGDFMMLCDLTLILVDPMNEIQMLFDTWSNPAYNIFQEFNVYTYVESLVSPPNLNR